MQKALLNALLTPDMTAEQNAGNFTDLLVRQEELKTMPFGEVWAEYCAAAACRRMARGCRWCGRMKRTFWRREHENILTAPWMVEMIRTMTNMYDHGWDERNGGNVSLLLEESQVNDYVDGAVLREIPTGFSCPELDGKYFLVTGTGKYFKNVQYAPEINLGLVRLTDGGETAQLLWGFADGGNSRPNFRHT